MLTVVDVRLVKGESDKDSDCATVGVTDSEIPDCTVDVGVVGADENAGTAVGTVGAIVGSDKDSDRVAVGVTDPEIPDCTVDVGAVGAAVGTVGGFVGA